MKTEYHFIGIGGMGMSALAHLLLQKNYKVSGSDVAETDVIKNLRLAGAQIQLGHTAGNIKPSQIVVYSSAIKESNPELAAAKEMNLPLLHRSEMLSEELRQKKPVLVAGSHGKTTTTALLSWILTCGGLDPSYAIGGIPLFTGINGHHGTGAHFVSEADESDGSFLRLPGFGGIVTNFDADHLDYWKSVEGLKEGFRTFCNRIESKNHFFYHGDEAILSEIVSEGISYGFGASNALVAKRIHQESHNSRFDILFEGSLFPDIELRMHGKYNILNALAAFGMAHRLGVKEEDIRVALKTFEGIKRRLEKKGFYSDIEIYDDYAHHPTEIKSLLEGFSAIKKEKRLVVVFEPHRYSRFKSCFDAFTRSFSDADLLVITDIYAAWEHRHEELTPQSLVQEIEKIGAPPAQYVPKSDLLPHLMQILRPHDILLAVGAGDLHKLSSELTQMIKNNGKK